MGKILVIAEKPSVGIDLGKVLSCSARKDGYLEGENYVVTWAVGHLVGLKYPEEHNPEFKKWRLEDLPIKYPIQESLKVLPDTKKQFEIIKKLIHRSDIDSIVNAGDAGREGYLIQTWIYRMAENNKPVKVLWASSFTKEAIEDSFKNLKDDLLFTGLLQEAEARAEADQFMGINYSRALGVTNQCVLAYGRCQTPLLKLVVDRDGEIENFESKPYYNVIIAANTSENVINVILVTEDRKRADLPDLEAVEKIVELCSAGASGVVMSVTEQEKSEHPPLLYNLAALQKDMGKKYGYTPDKTLEIAQKLYEERKVLSYPRTESQYLSMDLYHEINDHLQCCYFDDFKPLIDVIDRNDIKADKRYFNDHKVTDHYALIPTINNEMGEIFGKLTIEEKNVFQAVMLHFIAVFYPDYQYKEQEVLMSIHNFLFLSKNKCVSQFGFKTLFSDQEEEEKEKKMKAFLPVVNGEKVSVKEVTVEQKDTQPPKRYDVASLIAAMEKYGIGTAATRAEIIKKLQKENRQFLSLQKKNYVSTELGRKFIDIIPEKLKNPELTQRFEAQLKRIGAGEKEKEEFLQELQAEFAENLNDISSTAKINISDSGLEAKENIGICPICRHEIREGKKNYFCSDYKAGCTFNIGKTILGKQLTMRQVTQLLLKGKTDKIDGFTSKSGKKFKATLILDENGEIKFTF